MTTSRSGLGFDLHPLVDGRPLVLGGITVHLRVGWWAFDADVLTHACARPSWAPRLGDLGRMFPTPIRAEGVSSLVLLEG